MQCGTVYNLLVCSDKRAYAFQMRQTYAIDLRDIPFSREKTLRKVKFFSCKHNQYSYLAFFHAEGFFDLSRSQPIVIPYYLVYAEKVTYGY